MTLEVLLHGKVVGHIRYDDEAHRFEFWQQDDYFTDRHRDVLGQRFEDLRNHQIFRTSANQLDRLPAFFANVLPERLDTDDRSPAAAAREDFATLERLGADLPGAVTVRASGKPAIGEGRIFEEPEQVIASPEQRFSLAGVQPKLLAIRDETGRFSIPSAAEEGTWILKFASAAYIGLPENEWTTMSWAAACGIAVPPHELVSAEAIHALPDDYRALGPYVFAIQRYDRTPAGPRIHQEDFAQVFGLMPSQKYGGVSYEGLARYIADLCGSEDLQEFLRRLWFAIVSGNTDAHLKNWSLVYPDRRTARLSPAYDLVFVRRYLTGKGLALVLAKERDMERVTWDHAARVERHLERHGHATSVLGDGRAFVRKVLDEWRSRRESAPAVYRRSLEAHMEVLPLIRDLDSI